MTKDGNYRNLYIPCNLQVIIIIIIIIIIIVISKKNSTTSAIKAYPIQLSNACSISQFKLKNQFHC